MSVPSLRRLGALTAAAALLLALGAAPVSAASIVVNSLDDTSGGSACTLRDAIAAANSDSTVGGCAAGSGTDVITFSVAGTITLGSVPPAIASDLTIDGGGAITVDGANAYRPFTVNSGTVTLGGLTVTKGSADVGGGILAAGLGYGGTGVVVVTVTNSTISENTAQSGGGGLFGDEAATLTVTNSTISENTAQSGGGIYGDEAATLTVTNSTIS
ncbi:MAG TPA: CSLREA domain-containing protein, partial [Candidatus Limnocylindrales bacterium]|nr:CSLREA domain-containing protein [Candidatus Limnocylindrales bacterium]